MEKQIIKLKVSKSQLCSFCKNFAEINTKEMQPDGVYRWGFCKECFEKFNDLTNDEKLEIANKKR